MKLLTSYPWGSALPSEDPTNSFRSGSDRAQMMMQLTTHSPFFNNLLVLLC